MRNKSSTSSISGIFLSPLKRNGRANTDLNYCRADWVCRHCAKSHQERDCPGLQGKKKTPLPVAATGNALIQQHHRTTLSIPSIKFRTLLGKGFFRLPGFQLCQSGGDQIFPQTSAKTSTTTTVSTPTIPKQIQAQ